MLFIFCLLSHLIKLSLINSLRQFFFFKKDVLYEFLCWNYQSWVNKILFKHSLHFRESVGKAFAVPVWGCRFGFQKPHKAGHRYTSVTQYEVMETGKILGLIGQPFQSDGCAFRLSDKLPWKVTWRTIKEDFNLWPLSVTCMPIYVYTHMNTYMCYTKVSILDISLSVLMQIVTVCLDLCGYSFS